MLREGIRLLLVLVVGLTVYDLGRSLLPMEEGPAQFFVGEKSPLVQFSGLGIGLDGIHQINDADELFSVINLAKMPLTGFLRRQIADTLPVQPGRLYRFQVVGESIQSVDVGWMPAAMRISLRIPLRPGQMTQADWQDLPGVGPALAARIEGFRQKNGEIRTISQLLEVPGVGPRSIAHWSPFFADL